MAADTQPKKERRMVSWTREEDDLLREKVAVLGSNSWSIIATKFKDKTGRQCRRRWLTCLNTECKKGAWSHEEDMLLCEAHKIFGNRWTEIANVVSGRTDNAAKNRFSILCKKRSKHYTITKEKSDSCVHQRNKKIMVEPLAIKQHRSNVSDYTEGLSSSKRLTGEAQLRPPLAVLTQNFSNLSCFPEIYYLDTIVKSDGCDKLLSSFAVKACSENKNNAWKELQSYLLRAREDATLCISSELALVLNNFERAFKDMQCLDEEIQLERSNVNQINSQTSSESSTGFSKGNSIQSLSPLELFYIDGPMSSSSSLELTQSGGKLHVPSNSKFDSPLKTISAFHSFTEDIPSPEFSSSERKFLLTVLGASSSRPESNAKQTPFCAIDPHHLSLKQPYSCKRVLLNSL